MGRRWYQRVHVDAPGTELIQQAWDAYRGGDTAGALTLARRFDARSQGSPQALSAWSGLVLTSIFAAGEDYRRAAVYARLGLEPGMGPAPTGAVGAPVQIALASALEETGDLEEARRLAELALAAPELDDRLRPPGMQVMAEVHRHLGEWATAHQWLDRADAAGAGLADRQGRRASASAMFRGALALDEGDLEGADEQLTSDRGEGGAVPSVCRALAIQVALRRGDLEEASRRLAVAGEIADPGVVGTALRELARGQLLRATGRLDEAGAALVRAGRGFATAGSVAPLAETLVEQARLARDRGDLLGATESYGRALVIYRDMGSAVRVGQVEAEMAAAAVEP